MALFESGPKKLLRKLRKITAEGGVEKASSMVRTEKAKLLEEPDVALQLVEFLLEIGHPALAAEVSEDVLRRHRDIAPSVRDLIADRMVDFSRSAELLRVLWRYHLERHDFRGALEALGMGDKLAQTRLIEGIEDRMKSSMRFDGSIHPEADQPSLIAWALCLYRKERAEEAVDFLWKLSRSVDFPHRDVPLLAFWIGDREDLDQKRQTALMGIAAVSGQMEKALQCAGHLVRSDLARDDAIEAASVVEKHMVPVDGSGRSSAILSELYTSAGQLETAARVLEEVYGRTLDREKLEEAISGLASHPESGAAPLVLKARLALEKDDVGAATEALERAFESGDGDSARLIEVSEQLIERTGDRTGPIALSLASTLVERGELRDAVTALFPIVGTDPDWVLRQVQKLIGRDQTNAMVLTLLAVVLYETGKSEKAGATLEHLEAREDRQSIEDTAWVLDSLSEQVSRYPGLRESRAFARLRKGRREAAARDWFRLLLEGGIPREEGRRLLLDPSVRAGSASDLRSAGFAPESPFPALAATLVCLREGETEMASGYVEAALQDPELHSPLAERLAGLQDDELAALDLAGLLPRLTGGEAPAHVAAIIERLGGREDWKLRLATELRWGDPTEEAVFRLRYLLGNGRLFLAGSSFDPSSTDDPSIRAVAGACTAVADGEVDRAIEMLEQPVTRAWTSSLARMVLEGMISIAPARETDIRKLIARSFETERRFDELASVLSPVLPEEGVMEMLEELGRKHPGEAATTALLTRTSADRGDLERFRRYSSLLLDLDPGAAPDVVAMAREVGDATEAGEAYVYGASVARRFDVEVDLDGLLTRAVLLEPRQAEMGLLEEYGPLEPATEALLSLARLDAPAFAAVMREHPEADVPVNPQLVDRALESWDPSMEAEALVALCEHSMAAGLDDRARKALSEVAESEVDPWAGMASERLLRAVADGDAPPGLFWRSVRSPRLIDRALEELLPEGLGGLSTEEAPAVAAAVLRSGPSPSRLFELAEDTKLFPPDDAELSRQLAQACLDAYRSLTEREEEPHEPEEQASDEVGAAEPAPIPDIDRLVGILVRGRLFGEASRLARRSGGDRALAIVRAGLARMRREDPAEGPPAATARDLILAGDPSAALETLRESGDEGSDVLDTKGLALWMSGLRGRAIAAWLEDYRTTRGERPLRRLAWALEQAGSRADRLALRRVVADRMPEMAGMIPAEVATGAAPPLETITGMNAPETGERVEQHVQEA